MIILEDIHVGLAGIDYQSVLWVKYSGFEKKKFSFTQGFSELVPCFLFGDDGFGSGFLWGFGFRLIY